VTTPGSEMPRRFSRVTHAGVAAVYDRERCGAWVLVAHEWLEGETLAQWQERRPRPAAVAAALAQVGRGLQAVHAAGVAHGALSETSIVIDAEGGARVGGFLLRDVERDRTADERAFAAIAFKAMAAAGVAPARPSKTAVPFATIVSQLERLARPRRWLHVAALAGVAATVGAVVATRGDLGSRCTSADIELRTTWNDTRRDGIRDEFAATSIPFADSAWTRTEQTIQRYVLAWGATWDGVCAAMVAQSEDPQTLEQRAACLRRARGELDALLDVFADADGEVVKRATEAVTDLADPAACESAASMEFAAPPPDPRLAEAVDDVDALVQQASALHRGGRYEEAAGIAARAVDRARNVDYVPVFLRALSMSAVAHEAAGDYGRARADSREAAWLALGAGNVREAAEAAIREVGILAVADPEAGAADFWRAFAEALTRREALGPGVERALDDVVARFALHHGDHEEALAGYQRVADSVLRESGRDSYDYARAAHNVALQLHIVGRSDEARALLVQAIPVFTEHLGRESSAVATAVTTLAILDMRTGRVAQAEAGMREAYEIRMAVLGPEHAHTETSTTGLGNLAILRGAPDEAAVWFARSLQAAESSLGDHPRTGIAHANLGRALRRAGEPQQAIASLVRGLEVFARVAPKDPRVAGLHEELAYAHLETGDHDAARRHIDIAVRWEDEHPGADGLSRGRRLAVRADILAKVGDRRAAQVDARQALQLWDPELGDPGPDLARIRALAAP
ncbi:MAG: tetratricopeptide repeat-containing protein kinase family protein, partial [Myxococcota bacterium]